MKHFNLLKSLLLLCALIVGSLSSWAEDVTYKLTIDALDFNATSYAANNNEKTSDAVCTTDNSKTYEVKCLYNLWSFGQGHLVKINFGNAVIAHYI